MRKKVWFHFLDLATPLLCLLQQGVEEIAGDELPKCLLVCPELRLNW